MSAPTQGMLPINEQQCNDFVSYLKRHLALFFRRSNVVHPMPPPSLAGGSGGPGRQQHDRMGYNSPWGSPPPQTVSPTMGVAWPHSGIAGLAPNSLAPNPIYATGTEQRGGVCSGCGVPLAFPCCAASHVLADDELEDLESDEEDSDNGLDFENQDEAELA